MAEHLRWADGAEVTVRSCVLEQARSSSRRMTFQYNVLIQDRATGVDRHELVSAITPIRNRAVRPASELEAPSSPRAGSLAPSTYVAELKLLLQVFPYDQYIPALQHVLSDPGSLVARQLPEEFIARNGPGRSWSAEIIRYRVGTRATIRLSAETDAGTDPRSQQRRVYAKLFRNEEDAQRSFQIQQALWQRSTAEDAWFTVARPLFLAPEARTVALGEVSGTSLDHLLHLGNDVVPAVQQAARALAGVHHIPADELPPAPQPGTVRDEMERLRRVQERLHVDAPRLRPEVDAVARMIAARWVSRPGALTFFDFRPSHVVLGEQAALLDLDKIAIADPVVDVANMMAILDREGEHLSARLGLALRLPEIFRQTYLDHASRDRGERLPAAYALALLSRASRSLHGPVPATEADPTAREREAASVIRKAQDALREA